jgi:hypothetical protein
MNDLQTMSDWDLLRLLYTTPDQAPIHAELNRRNGGNRPVPPPPRDYHGEDVGPWSWHCLCYGYARPAASCPRCNP